MRTSAERGRSGHSQTALGGMLFITDNSPDLSTRTRAEGGQIKKRPLVAYSPEVPPCHPDDLVFGLAHRVLL